jgi:hypothetical protein
MAAILSRPHIARPATINQDNNLLYNFRRFKSYYPYANSNNRHQAHDNLANAATSKHTLIEEKRRILVVDDEPDIARLFKVGWNMKGDLK